MQIAIGSDHAAQAATERLTAKLIEAGHEVIDAASAPQPHGRADYAEQVAMLVLRHNVERGIIVTSRVVGAAMAANRVPGIRAASCHDAYSASLGAKAEGMNVLVLALHSMEDMEAVVQAYLAAPLAQVEVVGGLPPRRLQRVFAHVRENIAEDLAVADLAQVVGMSQYYFSKLFKLSTGITPHQYVMRQRVEHAQELLRDSNTPLAEIATRVGFETQSHFTSVFRRLAGATPKHYRERHQTAVAVEAGAEDRQKSATAA